MAGPLPAGGLLRIALPRKSAIQFRVDAVCHGLYTANFLYGSVNR
jgi:hypothetical protein